ncbi:phage tail length tape measure family protein [Mesorhizobium sp. B2-3-10]|uniref:phage tail length tape measure family protein n=1 Tax=Mesorhizobium sp. B2-3-10 TaxID=2589954 RepID=UPI0015E3A0A6|nr:phage tail length tape measure family protein [Mesorhizobium sp. B2-3-10]
MSDKTDDLLISVSTDLSTVKRQLRQLTADIGQTTSGIQKQWAATGAAIDKSINTTGVQKQINDLVGITEKAGKQWGGVLAAQGAELEKLRAKFNPVFSTIKSYQASVVEIQTAHRLGAISADEMTAAIGRERTAALASIEAIKKRNLVLADTPSLKRSGANTFNTANIAAQFQDIGVTAAMGMSPIQIALQQGTQLSSVLGTMGGTKGVIEGLGAAFTSIISPVSLVTIGVVGLTAAAIEYFTSFASGSDKNAETLKAEAELIQQVASKWGDALPGIKAYADERARLADQGDVQGAARAVIEGSFEGARTSINDVRSDLGQLIDDLTTMGGREADLGKLQAAFGALDSKVADQTATAEDAKTVQAALADIQVSTGIPAANDLAIAFGNLAAAIGTASAAAQKARIDAAQAAQILSPLGTLPPIFSGGGGFQDENQVQTDRANATKSKFQLELEKAAKRGSGSKAPAKTADDRFFEDIEAIRQRTIALTEEQSVLGLSFEAQTKRKVAFDLETTALKQVREEARKKGDTDWQNAQLTPDQIAKIDAVSEAYARQADALKKAQEMQQLQRDVLQTAFDDLRSSLEQGQLNWQTFGKIAEDVLDKIIDKIEGDLIDSIMQASSAGGSGLLGSALSWLTGGGGGSSQPPIVGGDPWAGMRAAGGPVTKGLPYLVGEHRPEVFVPNESGNILPRIPSLQAGGGGGGTQAVSINVRVDGATGNTEVMQMVAAGVQRGIGQFAKSPAFTSATVKSLKDFRVTSGGQF